MVSSIRYNSIYLNIYFNKKKNIFNFSFRHYNAAMFIYPINLPIQCLFTQLLNGLDMFTR